MYDIDENVPLCLTMGGGEREHDLKSEAEELAEVAPLSEVALPAVLRNLDMSKVETRTDLIRELSRSIPLNEYNLPIYIYRPDLLDPAAMLQVERTEAKGRLADALNTSITYLSYDMGFPTLSSDQPFWARLPWESEQGFLAFLQYLDLDGARSIHKIDSIPMESLREYQHQNYWKYRAVAFDAFKAAHHHRLREKRIFEVQDQQYVKAGRLLEKVNSQLTSMDVGDIPFDKLVGAFEKLAKVQRESIGMGQTAGMDKNGAPLTGTSVEVVMRNSAQKNHQERKVENDNFEMDLLLADPDALEQAQELIIRVSK